MTVQTFEDLQIWKEARRLTQEIYRRTRAASFSKDFGLTNQMQRAAISIMSNIAEVYERGANQELCQFLYITKGSCGELRAQLYLAFDQGYVTQAKADGLNNSLKRLSSMISNFISYLRESGMKAEKFQNSKPYLRI